MSEPTYEGGHAKYWIYFLVSAVIFILMLLFMDAWFWVSMPFMLTYLVYALGDV